MAATSLVYGPALTSLWTGLINFTGSTVKALICQSSYVPSQDTHQFLTAIRRTVADGVTNSTTTVTSGTAAFTSADVGARITGTGIPAGATIASVTNATTIVISAAATATATGVSLTFSHEVAGTGYTAGGVTLASKQLLYDAPSNTLTVDCADLSWPSSTITGRFLVFYVSTGTDSTSPLISYVDFGADQVSTAGTFPYVIPATGIAQNTAA